MWRVADADAAGNGLVLMDPSIVRAHYGGSIPDGTNLLDRYLATDEGDEVLAAGLFVPVLAIDDGGYRVFVRESDELSPLRETCEVIRKNGAYGLRCSGALVVAGVDCLLSWNDEYPWQASNWRPGVFAVHIGGFREMNPERNQLEDSGYEFVLHRQKDLPLVTADTGKGMQVNHWGVSTTRTTARFCRSSRHQAVLP